MLLTFCSHSWDDDPHSSPFATQVCHRRFTMVRLWSWCGHTFWSTWNCTNSHVGTFEHCEPLAAQTKMPNWFDVVHVMVSFLAYCLILKKQQEKQGISACSQGLANLRCCLFLSNGHCCALVVSMWRLWGRTGSAARFAPGICRPLLPWCCLSWWRCVRRWQEFTSMSFIQRMVSAPPHYPSLVTCSLVDVVVAISGKGDLKYLRGKWGQCEMRLHVWRMFFEGDWNHPAEIEELFFLKDWGAFEKLHPRRIFLESIQVDFLMQTSEFPSSQEYFWDVFTPLLCAPRCGPVASLLPGPWVADTWLRKVFCGCMYTTQNDSGSMMCSMPLWFYACFIMFLSCSLHVIPIRLHPGEAMVPTATCGASSLQPPGPSPIRNVERDSSDTDSTSEDSEESCCACVPVSHGEHRGTHEGKPKKVGKSGWNVDVREKACYEMNCYLIDVIYFLYVRKM